MFGKRATAVLAMAVVGVVAPGVAHAASGQISSTKVSGGSVRVVFGGVDLGAKGQLDARRVTVHIDGKPVSAKAVGVQETAAQVQRSAMLVVDKSGSMKGPGITEAKRAATAFLSAVPGDVLVGLVAFSDRPTVAVRPTRDRAQVRAALSKLVPDGGTSLYDGVLAGISALPRDGDRSLVILSDGADTNSVASLSGTVATLKRSGVAVNGIAFNTDNAATSALRTIAAARRGRVVSAANGGQLAAAFQSAAASFTRQVVIDAQLPADPSASTVPVSVTVQSTSGPLTATTTIEVPNFVAPPAPEDQAGDGSVEPAPRKTGTLAAIWMYLLMLFAGLCILFVVGAGVFAGRRDGRSRTRNLVQMYTIDGHRARLDADAEDLGRPAIARSVLDLSGRVVQRAGFEERLRQQLSRADVGMQPHEWLLLEVGACTGLGLLFVLLLHHPLGGALVGVIAGFGTTQLWLHLKARRRLRAFEEGLPDALQLVSGSLSSGFSLPQALDAVVRDGQQPISDEFSRALAEARLGIPIEDALDKVAERMTSTDFRWTVMAIRIQREVGGNLAEVLSTTAATMRERGRLRRQIRVLSAEGRLSAWILLGLPILMGAWMFAFRRSYIAPLYTEPLGVMMTLGAVVLFVSGALMMRKIVNVEV